MTADQILDVGKYSAFIWPACGVSALGFAWMIFDTLSRARRWRRQVERLEGQMIDAPKGPS